MIMKMFLILFCGYFWLTFCQYLEVRMFTKFEDKVNKKDSSLLTLAISILGYLLFVIGFISMYGFCASWTKRVKLLRIM